jgi:hypothetical protein
MAETAAHAPMEFAFQVIVAPQRLDAMPRSAQHPAGLPRQSAHRSLWRNAHSSGGLVSEITHRAPCNAGHGAQQVPRLRMAMKHFGDLADSARQARRGFGQNLSDLGKRALCRGRNGFGDYRKQLARSHSNKRQEVLGSFLLALGFCR